MASFDNNIGKMEQTVRRALTQEERRLLKLWDLTCESAARAKLRAEAPVQPVDEKTYTGRFKIVATKGYYEIYFVRGKLLLRPIEIDHREGVIDFLAQDPISIEEGMVEQAIAAADISRPAQIQRDISLSEPLLRSMVFRYLNG
jgi:hypothetical protein